MPIHFMHKSLPFDELCALYAASDVCLVSSTRDGMNLVSDLFWIQCTAQVIRVVRLWWILTPEGFV